MDIRKFYAAQEQDEKIEHMQRVLAFREQVFSAATASGSDEAKRLAGIVAFSLIGAAYGYKPCCVLEFCSNQYFGIRKPISACPVDGRVLCKQCEDEIRDTLG